jgi:prepilin-type N-terminal cleavage/methylation domain-containing protein
MNKKNIKKTNQPKPRRWKLGFSLLELSVSLIIISTLMVAVIKGSDLIDQAKLASARQKTANSPVLKIDGLVMWFETTLPKSFLDSEVINGGLISSWNDSSGANPNSPTSALQATATNKPSYLASGINDLPSLKFDGVDNFIRASLSSPINSSQLVVFTVCQRVGIKSYTSSTTFYKNGVVHDYNNLTSMVLAYEEGSGTRLQTFRYDAKSTKSPHPGNDISYIFSTQFDGTNNISYFNGIAQTTVSSTGTFNIDRVLIGARFESSTTSNYYNGIISELIIFNRALSTQERKDVEQYLSDKYKIPVS